MGQASTRIGEGRESAFLRRVTTSVVSAIAAGTLACSVALAPGPARDDARQTEARQTDAQPRESSSSEKGHDAAELALEEEGSRTTDATRAATAAGRRSTAADVLVTDCPDFGSTEAFAQLTQAIADFEGRGRTLGLTIVDLPSGRVLRYNADHDFYCASTIKAPFTVAGYELLVDTGQVDASAVDELARAEIIQSDNDAYLALRDAFGTDAFTAWLEAAAVSPGVYPTLADLAQTHYPHLTCRQLGAMWQHIYAYLSRGEGSAQKLIRYFRARQVSPIREALGRQYETWSKAGWIDFSADGGVEPATWDAGVVFAGSGSYVLVVGSDAPSELTSLGDVITAADAAHDALVADAGTGSDGE